MKFLDIDGPLIQFLSKLADLMWLNILTMVCCLPIFTVGASLTALHYMALKIARGEEGYITKGFFKAFKENFLQSTIIWVLFLVYAGVLATDYRILTTTDIQVGKVVRILLLVFAVMGIFTLMFVFPVQAKFSNTVKRTICNSFVFSIMQFPRTILMIVLFALPHVLMYFFYAIIPVVFVFSFSVPALLSAKLYNGFFMSLEEQILAREAEGQGETEEEQAQSENAGTDKIVDEVEAQETGQNVQ